MRTRTDKGEIFGMEWKLAWIGWAIIASGLLGLPGRAAAEAPETAGSAAAAAKIPDSEYVTVRDGHLSLRGRRVRFWGHIGVLGRPETYFSDSDTPERRTWKAERAKADIDLKTERLVDLGFNLHRLWRGGYNGKWDGGFDHDYEVGDNSRADITAYILHKFDQAGIKIWMSAMNSIGRMTPEDVGIIDDPSTAEPWQAAVREMQTQRHGARINRNLARIWDPRIEKIGIARMKEMASFPNKYKGGLRLADDPQVVVWEITNEEWWIVHMFAGRWMDLPVFFQKGLLAKWHAFLTKKYGDKAGVIKAWKFLLPGESLEGRTVLLAPLGGDSKPVLLNDSNPAVMKALISVKSTFGREDFVRRRGEDVIEFLVDLWVSHKKRTADALKPLGRSCGLSPWVWDTGTGYQIQCQYMHQQADAVTHCTYLKGFLRDTHHKRFPFESNLEAPPRLAQGVPWVEHNRMEGKPFFVYEIQINNAAKYRSEFPFRVASIAAIQDWDIVNWHDYGHIDDSSRDKPFEGALAVGHSLNLHYGFDEVQNSAMKAAAEVFKNGHLEAAPEPTTYVFGRKYLYDPASMDYGNSYGFVGRTFMPTVYRHGMRLLIDPSLEDRPEDPVFGGKQAYEEFIKRGYLIKGETIEPRLWEPCPLVPTRQIEYDWHKGHLKFDAPGAVAYTGFQARHGGPVRFRNGVELRNVTVACPPGMPYPVTEDEKYISFALVSRDMQSLEKTRSAVLSAVSTSFNTGYDDASGNPGKLPVLVARVAATIVAQPLAGMRYTMRDWHMKKIGEGTVKEDGVLRIPSSEPVFCVELER
jgi:hypothetical protein